MGLSWLKFWRRRRAGDASRMRVRMYTRRGCHLCETAWEHLRRAQTEWGFQLDAVDVDGDSQLRELYGESVPVVTIDEKVRFCGGVNPVLLTRLLRGMRFSSH